MTVTAVQPGSGTRAVLGFKAGLRVPGGRQVGAFNPEMVPIASVAQPTVAAGVSTGITGKAQYAILVNILGRGWTAMSTASAPITYANNDGVITYVPSVNAKAWAHRLVRKMDDTGTVVTTGMTGLNDVTFSGATYTGQRARYEFKFSTAGTPDKIQWRKVTLDPASGADVSTGSWSSQISVTGSAQTIAEGITITFAATTGHTLNDVITIEYRCDFKHIKTNWNATSTTFSDSTPVGSEDTAVIVPAADQTAANYGFEFHRFEPGTNFKRVDMLIHPTELTGAQGEPSTAAGDVDWIHNIDEAVRTSTLLMSIASFGGVPVSFTQATNKPEWTAVFEPSDLPENSFSYDAMYYKGGSVAPEFHLGVKESEIDFTFSAKKELMRKSKAMGTGGSVHSIAERTTIGGSYTGTGYLCGDAGRTFTTIAVKVSTGPSAGVLYVKFSIDGGSYTTTAYPVYYDTTSGRQIRGGSNQNYFIEMFDTSLLALGIDDTVTGTLRPLLFAFSGDLTGLQANDIVTFKPAAKFPAVYSAAHPTGPSDDGTYTGHLRRVIDSALFTLTRVEILTGGANVAPSNLLAFNVGSHKLSRPYQVVREAGRFGAYPQDVDVFGKIMGELDTERRYTDRSIEQALRRGQRYGLQLQFVGAPIRTNPGVYGAVEKIVIYYPNAEVESTDSVVGSDKVVDEKTKWKVKQSSDPSQPTYRITVVGSHAVDFAST